MDGEIVNLPNQNQKPSGQPPPQQTTEPQSGVPNGMFQDNKKKTGIFGAVSVGIIALILSLGILNYFNILPLSKLWPGYLGFLPHKANVVADPTPASTISLPKQAKETLITFLPTILNPSLLPQSLSDINLTDKSINQTVTGSWDLKDGRAITILTVSPNGKEISQLLIFFPYATTTSISAEFAQSTIPKLFSITPKGKWACKTIPNTASYCENFWEEQNGIRRGIALKESIPLSPAKKITISLCEHSQKSRLYSWKSCITEFAKTGVQ